MQGVCRVDAPPSGLEQALVDHRLRTAWALLPRLEHEDDVALELVAQLVQDPRGADEARDVQVVAAGVHQPVVARHEVERRDPR